MHTKALFVLLVLAVVAMGAPFAYGQTDTSEENEFIKQLVESGAGTAGTGAVAGFIMSLVAVLGKRIKTATANKEPINLRLLLITVAIGGAVGYFAPLLGISDATTIPAIIGIVYIVNQTLRPILAKWQTK